MDGRRAAEDLLPYVEQARPAQQALGQVLTQLAGYSLMLMTRRVPAMLPGYALDTARKAAADAHDRLMALRVPERAAHHFHHLLELSAAVRQVLRAAEGCSLAAAGDGERETLTRSLGLAVHHLRASARSLPGFEAVNLAHACCALHRGAIAGRG